MGIPVDASEDEERKGRLTVCVSSQVWECVRKYGEVIGMGPIMWEPLTPVPIPLGGVPHEVHLLRHRERGLCKEPASLRDP